MQPRHSCLGGKMGQLHLSTTNPLEKNIKSIIILYIDS